MATLVLTAVGTVVAGPFGAAIGAVTGAVIDSQLLFKSGGGRRGPRLDDLRVQTSSYGSPLPKIWGRMRVAGTVIWADDLRERRNRSGGKRQTATTYSYSASFAVAISARRVRRIGRIWADGKLLRGGAGDLKTRVTLRLHEGGEEQAVDPLIGANEGAAPAHRGLALLVFEDLALADFGNRIPSITAEIDADDGVDPHAVAAELATVEAAPSPVRLNGYAVTGGDVDSALGDLLTLTGAPVRADGNVLRVGETRDASVLPAGPDRIAADGERIERRGADELPDAVELAYFDPARDYQAGLQRAGTGVRVETLAVAAVMDAQVAAGLAAARLDRAWRARERRTVALPPAWMAVSPGQEVLLPETGGRRWRVIGARLERMVAYLTLEAATDAVTSPRGVGDGGRALPAPDIEDGPLALRLLDPPALPGELVAGPRLLAAVAGARGASLEVSTDGLAWADAGAAAPPAVLGTVVGASPAGAQGVWDRTGAIEVELLDGDMALENRTEAAVLSGENLAAVGDELIGFARAEPIGGRRWRLSGLLRGRFGTGHASARTGDAFVLIEADTLRTVPLPVARLGAEAAVLVTGRIGEPVEAQAIVTTEAIRPFAPCHLRCERDADGAVRLTWTRRSREGWAWLDGVDAPLGEERELYRVRVGSRVVDVAEPRWTFGAAEQAMDGVVDTPLTFAVEQVGALAVSRAATISI